MPKEPKYKLIEEETLRELLSTQFQLSYSIILLSYICQRNKLDPTLTANEAGGIIKLSPRQINDARNRCLIRAVNCGTCKLYCHKKSERGPCNQRGTWRKPEAMQVKMHTPTYRSVVIYHNRAWDTRSVGLLFTSSLLKKPPNFL